jgi:hypothetical protein
MKKLVCIALLAASGSAFASGLIDGIYDCSVTEFLGTNHAYLTINGHDDGRAIWAIPSVSLLTDLNGYGVGQISGNTFSGSTMTGAPFNFVINGNSLSGHAGVKFGNSVSLSLVTCNRFW